MCLIGGVCAMNKFKTIIKVSIRFAFDVAVIMFLWQMVNLILNKLLGVALISQDSALFAAVIIAIFERIYQWSKNNG